MRSFHERGDTVTSLITLAAVAAIASAITFSILSRAKSIQKTLLDSRTLIQIQSGAETLTLAYREMENRFFESLSTSGCNIIRPLSQAIQSGHGCPSLEYSLYSQNPLPGLFSLGSSGLATSCVISETASNCLSNANRVFLQIGATPEQASQRINGYSYEYRLANSLPERGLVEFIGILTDPSGKSSKHALALRLAQENFAHLEADGRVTQENPDLLSKCPGMPWANYKVLNRGTGQCEAFAQLASGTGLSFYLNRYFGLRPSDGQVIDLLAASSGDSYLVDPNSGQLTGGAPSPEGLQIFPKYEKLSLVNVDDFTLIEDQIYTIRGAGGLARLEALRVTSDGTWKRECICDLGAEGWGLGYTGIAATSWSQKLHGWSSGSQPSTLRATFFLKTDPGQFLTVSVRGSLQSGQTSAPQEPDSCGSLPPYQFSCTVVKDPSLQQGEYARTLGFDRVSDTKPYIIY